MILSAEVYGKEYINDTTDLVKLHEQYAKVIEKRDITLGGKKIRKMIAYIGEKQDDGTIDKNVVSISFDLGTVIVYIYTDKYETEKKSINAALTLFVKNFHMKKDLPLIDKARYDTPIGSFDIIPGMNLGKVLGTTKFVFDSPDIQNGTIEVKKYDCDCAKTYSTYSFKSAAYYLVDVASEDAISEQSEIKQNALGTYYLNTKIKKQNGEIEIVSQFYTKIDEALSGIKATFIMGKEDIELEKKYYQVLDTVTLNGIFPFKNATVGIISDTSSSSSPSSSLADHYEITVSTPAYVGEATDMTIKVLDASGSIVPDYTGTIYIEVPEDTGATIPYEQDGYTFTASDSGSLVIPKGLTFSQAGTMTVNVYDAVDYDYLDNTISVVVNPKR